MGMREKILNLAKRQGFLRSAELVSKFGISRQTAAYHLRNLVAEGLLAKTGSTRAATYQVAKSKPRPAPNTRLIKRLKNLEEDLVFREVERRLPLKTAMSKPVYDIAYYAFCEMLNNAIDHSRSVSVDVDVRIANGRFEFEIRDHGIGVFKNARKHFALESDYAAAEHVFKGKQTTDAARHTGQGIFFTSRIADSFQLDSYGLRATFENAKKDFKLEDVRKFKGTTVRFSVKTRSKKRLDALFKSYANDDFEFDKNVVRIKLSTPEGLVSRSQARRLLAGMDKFRRIVLDFTGVSGIGQAYADEIFRVFANRHPDIMVSTMNASPAVEFMVQRALRSK